MSTDAVEQIKDRLSIVDVIVPYVKLTKAGKYYKGLSPFNKEKTPSFFVTPDRGLYHCFSSGKGGDMFTFIQEMEGVDFRGALNILAEKAGVEITPEPKGAKDRREKIFSILSDAETFFVQTLQKNTEAQEYLKKRGLTEAVRDHWHVGYAPQEWHAILEYLKEKGHDEVLIEAAGLAKRSDKENEEGSQHTKKLYDRFRSRIMFPIADISGKVVGFSGRLFPEGDGKQAKYLNSPETSVFDKSRILYGLNNARDGIRKYDFAVLVEGQVDLLMVHQASYTNAVALSGTAFTTEHAKLIKRYTENLVLAFDGDRAGVAASGRAAAIALDAGLNVKIAPLTPGEDPADIIQKDVSLWKQAIKDAVHVVDFYLAYLKNLDYDERRFKLEVSRVVLPYVRRITNAIDQSHFVSRVADELGVPEAAVQSELQKLSTETPHTRTSHKAEQTHTEHAEPFLSRGDSLERLLVGLLQALDDSKHKTLYEKVSENLIRILGEERLKTLLASPDEARISVIEGDLFLEEHEKEGNEEEVKALLEKISVLARDL